MSKTPSLSPPGRKMELQAPVTQAAEGGGDKMERLTVDDMLQKYCGEFGRWQWKHFVLTSLAWALEGIHTMVMIFADRDPGWRCTTTGSAGCPSPGSSNVCGLGPGLWEWEGGLKSSTVSEFGLVCGHKYRVGLVQALFFAGCMIGAGTFGHLSDSKMGRKGTLTIVCIMNVIFGCLTAFSPNYYLYVLLRLLSGFSTGGTGLCAFVLATEPVGPTKRGIAGMSTFYFFSSGIALLAGIAYHFKTWRHLYIASSIPSILFVFVVLPFIHESPRWCLVRGKADDAMKIMHNIAKSNGKHLPENVLVVLDSEVNKEYPAKKAANEPQPHPEPELKEAKTGSLLGVLQCPMTRIRLLLAVTINFTMATVYYGLSLVGKMMI